MRYLTDQQLYKETVVGAFLKPSSGRRVKPNHSISKQYSIQILERVYKHYYYIIRGGTLMSDFEMLSIMLMIPGIIVTLLIAYVDKAKK